MQDLQAVFIRMQQAKKRIKDINALYKDALKTTPEYEELQDKLKQLRERKKQIENAIKETFAKEMIELDDLKVDLESDKELMSDMALSQLVAGKAVELTDEFANQYEPKFSVTFKKVT